MLVGLFLFDLVVAQSAHRICTLTFQGPCHGCGHPCHYHRKQQPPSPPRHCHAGGVQGGCSPSRLFCMDPSASTAPRGSEFTQTWFVQQPCHLNWRETLGQGNQVTCSSHSTGWWWGGGRLGLRLRLLGARKGLFERKNSLVSWQPASVPADGLSP